MGRVGIYGGTFNPPHLGHVSVARQAIDLLALDSLLVIPASVPPHKTLPEDSPTTGQRLELVRSAFADLPGLTVSDLELRRTGHSYTADTLHLLHQMYPEDELCLIMGTDMFLSFPHWYRPDAICQYASLAVFLRDVRDKDLQERIHATAQEIEAKFAGKVILVRNEILPVSSTDIRRMLTFGAGDCLMPEAVYRQIQALGLYGSAESCRNLSMDALERKVIGLLNPKRVAHVLGCRDMAVKLAAHYGADQADAARAGLLHDVTKALSPSLQKLVCQAHGVPGSSYAHENGKTLHAFSGALVARNIFGENEAVVRAIGSHTTGCAHMDTLQKIIYIADYVEMNRNFPGVEELRALAFCDLDRAMLAGLRMTVDLLVQQGRDISIRSQQAIAWLEKQVCQQPQAAFKEGKMIPC